MELMDVCRGVIALSQMCNEPCFAPVTFRLIDYKSGPFSMQRCRLLTMQHSFREEITFIAREKEILLVSTACCLLN